MRAGFALTFLAMMATTAVEAATVTLDATHRGWYDPTGASNGGAATGNYLAGDCRGPNCGGIGVSSSDYRNWFNFDLSAVSSQISAAHLHLFNPGPPLFGPGFASDGASETYDIFDVSTALATLISGGGLPTWTDLGSGTGFGSHVATNTDNDAFIDIALNAAALAALNAATGDIAFGGAVTTLNGVADDEHVFAFSVNQQAQLVLTVDDGIAVPTPGALLLAATALFGLGFARRRG